MNPGEMEDLITIKSPGQTVDEEANVVENWVPFPANTDGRRYAKVTRESGREIQLADQTVAITTHKVEIYYESSLSAIDTTKRVELDGRNLNIVSVDVQKRKGEITLECVEAA